MAEEDLKVLLILEAQDRATSTLTGFQRKLEEVKTSVGGVGGKVEEAGAKAEGFAKKSESMGARVGGVFSKLGQEASNWGLPFGNMLDTVGQKMAGVEGKTSTLGDKMNTLGKITTIGGAAGLAAWTAEALHWTASYKGVEAQVAATGDMTTKQADAIGDAVNKMAGDTTINSQKMLGALAPVSAQLEDISGHTLTAKEATGVLSAATNLAEATHTDLSSTLASESKLMQAYGQSLSQAGADSDILFRASTLTGQGVGMLTQAVTRIKGQLGAAAPTLADTTAFMLDLAEHGESGRASIGAVSAAFSTLLNTASKSKDVAAAQKGIDTANKAVVTSADAVAKAQERLAQKEQALSGKSKLTITDQITLQNLHQAVADAETKHTAATEGVTKAQEKLFFASNEVGGAAEKMGLHVFDAKGQFVGMQSVIAQLQPMLKGHTEAQQLATLQAVFGNQANRKLLDTILAGPDAYTKATEKVTEHGAAHKAAETATNTLGGTTEKLESKVHSLGVQYGEWLTPKLVEAEHVVMDVVGWFEKHKTVAEGVAAVVGGVLTLAVTTFAFNTAKKFISSVGDMVSSVGKLKDKITGTGAGAGEESLAGEGESAATSLDSAAENLQAAAEALNEAAAKLSGVGGEMATEMETGASTASGELEAAGAAVSADMEAGATAAASELEAGGTALASEEGAGAAGGAGGGGMAGGGLLGAAAIGGTIGVTQGQSMLRHYRQQGVNYLQQYGIADIFNAGMKSNDIGTIETDIGKLDQAGQMLTDAYNKMGVFGNVRARSQLGSAIDQVQKWAEQLHAHGEDVFHSGAGGGGATAPAPASTPATRGVSGTNMRLRMMQEGGVVTTDTVAVLHAPEAVLPLSNPARVAEIMNDVANYLPQGAASNPFASAPAASAPGAVHTGTRIDHLEVNLLTVPMTPQQAAQEVAWQVQKV